MVTLTSRILTLDIDGCILFAKLLKRDGQDERPGATMRKIAAAACVVSICSASSVFATDLIAKTPQQEQISRNYLVSSPTGHGTTIFHFWRLGRPTQLAE